MLAEELRRQQSHARAANWHRWGPNLFERQWGTIRKDYSENGDTGLFGGNSNWRGPVWFPVNFLLVAALERV